MTQHTPGPLLVMGKIKVTFQTSGAKRMVFGVARGIEHAFSHIGFAFNEKDAQLFSAAPDLLAEIEKQIKWLEHIRPQITAPDSVLMGFDQGIKYMTALAAKARGES